MGRVRLALEAAVPDDLAARRRELAELELSLDEIRTEIRRRNPRLGAVVAPEAPTVEEVQRQLPEGEVLLAYWLSEERLMVWALGRESYGFFQAPVAGQTLEEEIGRYIEPFRFARRAEDAALGGAEAAHLDQGLALYGRLIGFLPDWVRQAERLLVVPDGVLHYLPFGSLVVSCPVREASAARPSSEAAVHEIYQACRYVGLEKPLSYGPSIGAVLALRERREGRGPEGGTPTILALAPSFEPDDLPSAVASEMRSFSIRGVTELSSSKDEVERLGSFFPQGRTLLGAEASEGLFKSRAADYRLLHLATHGLVRDDLPMSSGVLLAAGDREDGLLQAYEVLGLELEAELVTLSACRTGRGSLKRGEGIVGLSRAFLHAGASSVLVSLWDVEDRSTAVLMESFYRRMVAGADRAEALRGARSELFRQQGKGALVFTERPISWAHPRFWAGFVLIGAP